MDGPTMDQFNFTVTVRSDVTLLFELRITVSESVRLPSV